MKNGKSVLRTPPNMRSKDAQRLAKITEWSEEPARLQASVLQSSAVSPVPSLEDNTASTQAIEERQPPWEGLLSNRADQKVRRGPKTSIAPQTPKRYTGYNLPVTLYEALSWLGSTTYGETASSIVIQALEDEVNDRLAKLGLPLIERSSVKRE